MRILITNDDGINAPGLAILEQIAAELGDDIWVVAPAREQSGVGHCISYSSPVLVTEITDRRFALDGSPADCILAGLHHIMPDAPDLILSGVNRGNNSAENTLYSGTLGAAMEGALQGIPSIGLSQFFGPHNRELSNPFDSARSHGVAAIRACLSAGFDRAAGYQAFYNLNFPPFSGAETKGLRASAIGNRGDGAFGVIPQSAPNGRSYLWARGGDQQLSTAAGTDAADNLAGYVSITPMRADMTARDMMDAVSQAIKGA